MSIFAILMIMTVFRVLHIKTSFIVDNLAHHPYDNKHLHLHHPHDNDDVQSVVCQHRHHNRGSWVGQMLATVNSLGPP